MASMNYAGGVSPERFALFIRLHSPEHLARRLEEIVRREIKLRQEAT